MKPLIIAFITLTLAACGSNNSSTQDSTIPHTNLVINDTTLTVSDHSLFDLIITGDRNTITIPDNNAINEFRLRGDNNLITIGINVTSENNDVVGNDNTIMFPIGKVATFDRVAGSGNQFIEY